MSAHLRLAVLCAIAVLLIACSSGPKGAPALGQAYVGPAQLNLRKELAPKSPTVATLKHGDRLDILGARRRFVKVRTATGAIGWTDMRQLMSTEQMEQLRKLAEDSARLPSQGQATVYEPLNIHTEPSRGSPSFAQIGEKQTVDVIGHRIAPKTSSPREVPELVIARPAAISRRSREKKESARIPPPPMPKPPAPPRNWLEMSKSALPPELVEKPAEKPAVMEDWSLVRAKDGTTGWVLSRNLIMAIPDEVAQYAEGHRITSYFPLADVHDGDQLKHFWLWTTLSEHAVPYEFDGVRVFVWSLRHHRYETAYRERNLKGYYPVEAHKGSPERGEGAMFSLILEEDGQITKNTYTFNGYRVTLVKKEPYRMSAPGQAGEPVQVAANASGADSSKQNASWYSRLRDRMRKWFR
ncbi:MAG TPA: SH3 domain-containing protein [Bryobacteraceae bacterium]|jgi:SH3-like domain-containing protein|nr:SH3 domain-containing protein [Bryobacteraceae bacterium]